MKKPRAIIFVLTCCALSCVTMPGRRRRDGRRQHVLRMQKEAADLAVRQVIISEEQREVRVDRYARIVALAKDLGWSVRELASIAGCVVLGSAGISCLFCCAVAGSVLGEIATEDRMAGSRLGSLMEGGVARMCRPDNWFFINGSLCEGEFNWRDWLARRP